MATYKMTLADGTTVKFTGMNGNNYISEEELDTSIFTDANLESGTIKNGSGVLQEEIDHWAFVQQMKWPDGTYYLCFREKSPDEIKQYDTDVIIEEAIAELYELIAEDSEKVTDITKVYADLIDKGEKTEDDLPGGIKIDPDKRLDK